MKLFDVIADIRPVSPGAKEKAAKRLDSLIKPLGSLGRLEDIAIRMAGITGNVTNRINKKCTIIMAGDHGVCKEGVSSAPQEITAWQTVNMLKGVTGINVLSKCANADVKVVDIGIKKDMREFEKRGLLVKKVREGTGNMAERPAMSPEEAVCTVETGIDVVRELVRQGYDLLGTGEMGIGNTTPSSAMLVCFTGCSIHEAAGKGAGLTDERYENKKSVIKRALEVNKPDGNSPLDVLSKVGGFEIAGLTGCFLGAALERVPIVMDGFISSIAALTACRLNPLVKDYLFASHASAEPGHKIMMAEIGLKPVLDLDMRLGEGTGCPLAFQLIECALASARDMATFQETEMQDDFLVEIK